MNKSFMYQFAVTDNLFTIYARDSGGEFRFSFYFLGYMLGANFLPQLLVICL